MTTSRRARRRRSHRWPPARPPARRCLAGLPKEDGNLDVALAAVRLLAGRRPAGAADALLAYLPDAPDELLQEEILEALAGPAAPGEDDLRAARKGARDALALRRR